MLCVPTALLMKDSNRLTNISSSFSLDQKQILTFRNICILFKQVFVYYWKGIFSFMATQLVTKILEWEI